MRNKLVKAVAYCRVSTDSKEQEQSYENQQSYFKRKLSKENGFELVGIYADKGLTGTAFRNRTEFNNMLNDAGLIKKEESANVGEIRSKYINTTYVVNPNISPKFNYIYVKNSSRFARNIEVVSILRGLKKQGVVVYFEDIGKSTENEADDMLLQFLFTMDERESKDRSMKVRMGNVETARQGKIRSTNLYGYKYSKIDGSLRIIPEEAEIVKKIFDLRLQGHGSRVICKIINNEGYRTRKGVEFIPNVVTRMLQNPTYLGKAVRNKFDVNTMFGQNSRILKDKDEWIIQDSDKVDRIIEDEVFDKVQELIKKSTSSNIKKGKYQGRSELSTKIICNKCGKNYTRNKDTKIREYGKYERIFYNCSSKKRFGKSACDSINIPVEEIEKLLNLFIGEGKYKKVANNFLNNAIYKSANKAIERLSDSINNIEERSKINSNKEEITKLKDKLKKFLDIYLDDGIAKDIFDDTQNEIKNKIDKLEKENLKLSESEDEIRARIKSINNIMEAGKKLIEEIPEELSREEFIENYLISINVKENGKLQPITKVHATFVVLNKLIEGAEVGESSNKIDKSKSGDS